VHFFAVDPAIFMGNLVESWLKRDHGTLLLHRYINFTEKLWITYITIKFAFFYVFTIVSNKISYIARSDWVQNK
jgi:hypothetical protein